MLFNTNDDLKITSTYSVDAEKPGVNIESNTGGISGGISNNPIENNGEQNNPEDDEINIMLGKTYQFKSAYTYEELGAMTELSNNVEILDDGSICATMFLNGSETEYLEVIIYPEDVFADAYAITYVVHNCGYVYLSQVCADLLNAARTTYSLTNPATDDPSSELTAGWHYAYNGDIYNSRPVETPYITISQNATFFVDDIDAFVSLFERETEVPALTIHFGEWYVHSEGSTIVPIMFFEDGTCIIGCYGQDTQNVYFNDRIELVDYRGEFINQASVLDNGNTIRLLDADFYLATTLPDAVKAPSNVLFVNDNMGGTSSFFTENGDFVILNNSNPYSINNFAEYYNESQIIYVGNYFYVLSGPLTTANNVITGYKYVEGSSKDYLSDGDIFMMYETSDPVGNVIDKAIYSSDLKEFWGYSNVFDNNFVDFAILDGTEIICRSFFREYRSIKTLTIPSSVTTIDEADFSVFTDLTTIYFAGTEAEWEAFNIELPDGVTVVFD
jgi:hypothetical protein